MAKKIVGIVKLQVPAGKANPSPPIGPALGQRGLNIMEFCKAFNAATQSLEPGMPIPVVITAFGDRSFTFVTKSPPNSYFLKKAAGVEKGSQTAGKGATVGQVTMAQIREIAGGGSYLSQSDLRAHFGLGSAEKIDKLEITWPSGANQAFKDFRADQYYSIQEGKDELSFQPFVKPKK